MRPSVQRRDHRSRRSRRPPARRRSCGWLRRPSRKRLEPSPSARPSGWRWAGRRSPHRRPPRRWSVQIPVPRCLDPDLADAHVNVYPVQGGGAVSQSAKSTSIVPAVMENEDAVGVGDQFTSPTDRSVRCTCAVAATISSRGIAKISSQRAPAGEGSHKQRHTQGWQPEPITTAGLSLSRAASPNAAIAALNPINPR